MVMLLASRNSGTISMLLLEAPLHTLRWLTYAVYLVNAGACWSFVTALLIRTECHGQCMAPQMRLLGLTLHGDHPVCYSTPSSLMHEWKLKWGPTLRRSWAMTARSLSNIFTGSLINALPFYFSWSCLLLSVTAWMANGPVM